MANVSSKAYFVIPGLLWEVVISLSIYLKLNDPYVERPSCLQTTNASLVPHESSHTVVHSLFIYSSTRPLYVLFPSLRRTISEIINTMSGRSSLKLDLYDKNNLQIYKITILSETSILYLIRYASFILSSGLHLYRRVPTSEHCWKKNSGSQRTRTSDLWITSLMRFRLS